MVENDSLLREVDDAVRQDRLLNLWNQFKMPLIYAAVALVLVTAGSSMWKNYQQSKAEETTLALEDAQQLYDAKQYDKAAKAFEAITHTTRGNLADMTRLWHARALLGAGKQKAALRVLQNIVIAPEGRDLFWRDLACVHVAGLVATSKEVPQACAGTTASPLSPLLAQLHAAGVWSDGDAEAARSALNALANNNDLSPDVRAQANAWATTIHAHKKKE